MKKKFTKGDKIYVCSHSQCISGCMKPSKCPNTMSGKHHFEYNEHKNSTYPTCIYCLIIDDRPVKKAKGKKV